MDFLDYLLLMNVPIVYLCAFSFFLSLTLFFYNKGYKGANRFLSGYLLCSSAFLLALYFLIYNKSAIIVGIFSCGFPALYFLIGPLAYFYVRSILTDNVKLSKTEYLHFLPFVLVFIGTIPFLFSSWEYKFFIGQKIIDKSFMGSSHNTNFLVPKLVNQLIRPLFSLFYFLLIFRAFLKDKNVFKAVPHSKVMKVWLNLFFLIYTLATLFYIIVQLVFYFDSKFLIEHLGFYYFLNSIALLYLVFNISLALFPQILYGLPIPQLTIYHPHNDPNAQPIQENREEADLINENKSASVTVFFQRNMN